MAPYVRREGDQFNVMGYPSDRFSYNLLALSVLFCPCGPRLAITRYSRISGKLYPFRSLIYMKPLSRFDRDELEKLTLAMKIIKCQNAWIIGFPAQSSCSITGKLEERLTYLAHDRTTPPDPIMSSQYGVCRKIGT